HQRERLLAALALAEELRRRPDPAEVPAAEHDPRHLETCTSERPALHRQSLLSAGLCSLRETGRRGLQPADPRRRGGKRLRALPAHRRAARPAEAPRGAGAPRRAALPDRAPGLRALAAAGLERSRRGNPADRTRRAAGGPAPPAALALCARLRDRPACDAGGGFALGV